jgi:hypothetical protein
MSKGEDAAGRGWEEEFHEEDEYPKGRLSQYLVVSMRTKVAVAGLLGVMAVFFVGLSAQSEISCAWDSVLLTPQLSGLGVGVSDLIRGVVQETALVEDCLTLDFGRLLGLQRTNGANDATEEKHE